MTAAHRSLAGSLCVLSSKALDGDALWSDVRRAVIASRRAAGLPAAGDGGGGDRGSDSDSSNGDSGAGRAGSTHTSGSAAGEGEGVGAAWRRSTTVYMAATAGDADVVRRLLAQNHSPNDARPGDNSSALDIAANMGQSQISDAYTR